MSANEPSGERDRDATEIDASFAAIVAGWDSEELAWPEQQADQQAEESIEAAPAEDDVVIAPEEDAFEDEGHYEPPEPPPIPRPRGAALGAIVMLGIGLVLLFIPGLIGLTDQVGLPLGLLAEACGLFWLFLLLRTGPPIDSGWDDGSRL